MMDRPEWAGHAVFVMDRDDEKNASLGDTYRYRCSVEGHKKLFYVYVPAGVFSGSEAPRQLIVSLEGPTKSLVREDAGV